MTIGPKLVFLKHVKSDHMKAFYTLFFFILATASSFSQTYYVYTAVGNGQWNTVSNWSIAQRTDGKKKNKVIIPAGRNIVADNNVNYLGLGDVEVELSGKLTLATSTKLLLSANSVIKIEGGNINGNVNTQQILIGGVVKYDGSLDMVKTGFTYADNTTGVSPNGFFTPSILAVHFVNFSAVKTTKSNVLLTWTTSEEVNNKHFNLQKSVDGVNWKQIATVFPQTVNDNQKTYQYTDPNVATGQIYYRILQVDLDGSYTYSEVRTVNGDVTGSTIKAYASSPDVIVLESTGGALAAGSKVSVLTSTGQLVFRTSIQQQTKVSIRTNKQLSGIYIVSVEQSNGTVTAQKLFL